MNKQGYFFLFKPIRRLRFLGLHNPQHMQLRLNFRPYSQTDSGVFLINFHIFPVFENPLPILFQKFLHLFPAHAERNTHPNPTPRSHPNTQILDIRTPPDLYFTNTRKFQYLHDLKNYFSLKNNKRRMPSSHSPFILFSTNSLSLLYQIA